MMFSNSAGSVKRPRVTTGKVISTGAAVGDLPIEPAPNCWFCAATARWISLGVMPSVAMRSGLSQIRIARSGTPKIAAWFAPGMRLSASSTYRSV
jgi:hypothetical protein